MYLSVLGFVDLKFEFGVLVTEWDIQMPLSLKCLC